MAYIHFIVNPISGNGKHNLTASALRQHFERSEFRIEVDYTKHKNHAVALTKSIIGNNPDCVVACGGDGTINEVASVLVGTGITLGIIPVGSGNGLAAHLNIPKNIGKAIAVIRDGNHFTMDVGKVNDHYFFSNMGIGIDAMIIKKYERAGKRALMAYIKAALWAGMEFKPRKAILSFKDNKVNENPFLLFVSNSNEMGYGMGLTPKASLDDGWLDLVVVPKLSFFKKLILGYYVLKNKPEHFRDATRASIQELRVEIPEAIFLDAQIDGEYRNLKTNVISVSVLKKSLKVII